MARYNQNFFDPNRPLYIRKSFQGNDRMWLIGQLFDWQYYKIPVNRVRQLFRSSYLRHEEPGEVCVPNTGTEYSIKHHAGPYYNVVSPNGDLVNDKALHKSKAQELADELNATASVGIAENG